MFKTENFHDNKTEHKYQNKEKKEMGSANITQTRLRETEGGGGVKKRRWFVHDLDH